MQGNINCYSKELHKEEKVPEHLVLPLHEKECLLTTMHTKEFGIGVAGII